MDFKVVPSNFAKIGERRVLNCGDTHQAHPRPTMLIEQQWDSKKLNREEGHNVSYVIEKIDRRHAGSYICKAQNEEGKVLDHTQIFVQCEYQKFERS